MTYVAIADWDEDGRVLAESRADTAEEVTAIVARMVSDGYTNAFSQQLPDYSPAKWRIVNGAITEGSGPPVTVEQVQKERDRRLAAGFAYDFGDARGVHTIGTTEQDMDAWDREVTPYANALVNTSDTTTTISIVTETGPCLVTGPEWQEILIAAAAVRQPIWVGYFTLKAQNPIPANYTADSHWTSA